MNVVVTKDHKLISNYCCEFYKKIYTSNYSQTVSDAFLISIEVKTIDKNENELCDMPVSVEEVIKAINHLKNNKSPSTDILSTEFYNEFTKDLSLFCSRCLMKVSVINAFHPP